MNVETRLRKLEESDGGAPCAGCGTVKGRHVEYDVDITPSRAQGEVIKDEFCGVCGWPLSLTLDLGGSQNEHSKQS